MFTIEGDKRPPYKGWAGGNYQCECLKCGEGFIGDKRCITCADCAYDTKSASSGNSDLLLGGRYNWINQTEQLVYVGKQGVWHQFSLVGDADIWCEVLARDLHMMEKTIDQ